MRPKTTSTTRRCVLTVLAAVALVTAGLHAGYGAAVRTGTITNAAGETPFQLQLTTHDGEDVTVLARATDYEYAPSVMRLDGTTVGMWFCGGGGSGATRGDSIWYTESADFGRSGTWTAPVEVIRPSNDDTFLDHGHACDPSVVQFGSSFYVFYTATADWRLNPDVAQCPAPMGCDNRIFVARVPTGARADRGSYQKLVNVGECLAPGCFQWQPFWASAEHPPAAVVRHEAASVWRRAGTGPAGGPGKTTPYTNAYGIGQASVVDTGALRIWFSHVTHTYGASELWVRDSGDLGDPFRLQDAATYSKKVSNTFNDVNYDVAYSSTLDRYVVNIARDDLNDPSGRPCVHVSHRTGADTAAFSAPIMSGNLGDQAACFLLADPSAHNSALLRDPSGRLVEMPGHGGGPAYSWVYYGDDLDKIATDAGQFDIERVPFTLRDPSATPPGSAFTAVTPTRLLDTRDGTGAPAGKPAPGQTVAVQVAGRGGVPAGAAAAVLNVTVTEPDAAGYVTAYPCDEPRPVASNVNFVDAQTVPNLVVVGLDPQGRACLSATAATHLVADVAGFHAASGARFTSITPARLLDTRDGTGSAAGKVADGQTVVLQVSGRGGVPPGATSAVLNVTVTDPEGSGYVTAHPCGTVRPLASNVNFEAGQTVPNLVVVGLDAGGSACLATTAAAHLVADVAGYHAATGAGFTPVTPSRVLDTRIGTGYPAGKVGEGQTLVLQVGDRGGVPAGATSALLNVTVTDADAAGYVTVFPCGSAVPLASNLNFVAGQTVANLVSVGLDPQGRACLFASRSTHLLADTAGFHAGS